MLYIYLAMLESPEDQDKMTELYVAYRDYLINVAQSILHNETDAEDAVHHAFLRVARNFTKIGEVSSHQTRNYLVIIVRGFALNLLRKRSKVIEVPFEFLEGADNPLAVDDLSLEEIEYEAIVQAVEELPVMYRDVFYLRYFEDRSVKEVAKHLNISESAVKKRFERARLMLQKVLSLEGIEAK